VRSAGSAFHLGRALPDAPVGRGTCVYILYSTKTKDPFPSQPHRRTTSIPIQLSKATPHELIGSILGVSYALETFAKVLTPPLGGYLLDHRGPHTLGWASVLFLLPCLANVALESARWQRAQRQVGAEKKVQ
jgi:hypothetical protein